MGESEEGGREGGGRGKEGREGEGGGVRGRRGGRGREGVCACNFWCTKCPQ